MVSLEDSHGKANGLIVRAGGLRRVANASLDGETIIAVDGASDGIATGLLLDELERGSDPSLLQKIIAADNGVAPRPSLGYRPIIFSDGEGTVKVVNSAVAGGAADVSCKRRLGDIHYLREALVEEDIKGVRHIPGPINPADPLTKKTGDNGTWKVLLSLLYEGKAPPKEATPTSAGRTVRP